MSIAALVLGIVWIPFITSILAIIFGVIARRQIDERGQKGSGMALAGIILGCVGVFGSIIWVILIATAVHDINNLNNCTFINGQYVCP